MCVYGNLYGNLYSENALTHHTHDNSREGMFFTDIPQISDESKSSCEGKMTKEECLELLKSMKLNKSPGNDGFIYR